MPAWECLGRAFLADAMCAWCALDKLRFASCFLCLLCDLQLLSDMQLRYLSCMGRSLPRLLSVCASAFVHHQFPVASTTAYSAQVCVSFGVRVAR